MTNLAIAMKQEKNRPITPNGSLRLIDPKKGKENSIAAAITDIILMLRKSNA